MIENLFSARSHSNEDCERHTTSLIKGELQKLWDRTVAHIKAAMEARRYRDPRDMDPDYEAKLRRLEGQISDIARDHESGVQIHGPYNEGNKGDKWKDWILGIVGAAIVIWLGRISMQLDDLADLKAQMKQVEKHEDQTDKHLEATDNHIDRMENRLFRAGSQ